MKRLILELGDNISDIISVTAIRNHINNDNKSVTNVKGIVIELKEDVTTAQITFEEGEE